MQGVCGLAGLFLVSLLWCSGNVDGRYRRGYFPYRRFQRNDRPVYQVENELGSGDEDNLIPVSVHRRPIFMRPRFSSGYRMMGKRSRRVKRQALFGGDDFPSYGTRGRGNLRSTFGATVKDEMEGRGKGKSRSAFGSIVKDREDDQWSPRRGPFGSREDRETQKKWTFNRRNNSWREEKDEEVEKDDEDEQPETDHTIEDEQSGDVPEESPSPVFSAVRLPTAVTRKKKLWHFIKSLSSTRAKRKFQWHRHP